jgi:hypothetical protein
VPGYLRANGNPDMVLELTIEKGFLGLGRTVRANASCRIHLVEIPEPPIGCQRCNAERPNLTDLFGGEHR